MRTRNWLNHRIIRKAREFLRIAVRFVYITLYHTYIFYLFNIHFAPEVQTKNAMTYYSAESELSKSIIHCKSSLVRKSIRYQNLKGYLAKK
jgi:hypothetical protein